MNQKGIILSYKNSVKQFFVSRNTQQHLISALLKRAFHLTSDVKFLRHPRGYSIALTDVFNFNINQPFEVIVQEETSEDRSRSQTFSQKALTKRSGRKYPAQQKQLNEAKFYIDDFQFFMQEISSKHSTIHIGILFFNTKKSATYFGKKILREIIFQFDQIQFFYGLHPLKRHSNNSLLGDTLVFTLFQGTKMINQRQFPENLSAIEEISGYLKCLIKNQQLPDTAQKTQSKKQKTERRNFIQTHQQRSFDAKAENDLRLDEFDHIPQITTKSKTVDKAAHSVIDQAPPVLKFDSPIKSQLGNQINQISFENEFYQPSWFVEGDQLNRIQKSFISALVRSGDQDFANFCNHIDLKKKDKETLNIELVKVYLQNYINKKFANLTQQHMSLIELNMDNRQSYIFSLLLKLNKFGNIDDFVANVQKKISTLMKHKCSYVQLARQIEKKKSSNFLRLKGCDSKDDEQQGQQRAKLVGKDRDLNQKNSKIADFFFRSASIIKISINSLKLPKQFDESQEAVIKQMLLQKDPFLIENYVPSKWPKKKFTVLPPKLIRKYLKQNEKRYKRFRQFPFEERIKLKFKKIEHFSNLLYYLYKQRTISSKQKISFVYLFLWSDLNVLACFQFYLYDRNLEEFIETMYTIDYTYYLEDKYGLEMSEIEHFTLQSLQQLIILFLISDFIQQTQSKITLEQIIRDGDKSIWQTFNNSNSQNQLIQKIRELAEEKQIQLQQKDKVADLEEKKQKQKKLDMKIFIQQIKPVHFKTFKDEQLVYDLIDLDEPLIHGIFQVYYSTNQVVQWIDSFQMYIKKLKELHMAVILKNIAKKHHISIESMQKCRTDLIKGVYEVYMAFKDQQDAVETLDKIISKSSSYAQ